MTEEGERVVIFETYPVSIASDAVAIALEAFGIDTSDMKEFMDKEIDEADLQAIRDRTLHPSKANVPKPDDFEDEEFVAVASSYAITTLVGRKQARDEQSKDKDRRVLMIVAAAAAVVGLFGGGGLGFYLVTNYLDAPEVSPEVAESQPAVPQN